MWLPCIFLYSFMIRIIIFKEFGTYDGQLNDSAHFEKLQNQKGDSIHETL